MLLMLRRRRTQHDQVRLQPCVGFNDRRHRIAARHHVIHRQSVRLVKRCQKPQPLQAVRTNLMPSATRRMQHDQMSPRNSLCVVEGAQRSKRKVRRRQHIVPLPKLSRRPWSIRSDGQNRARRMRQQLPRHRPQRRTPRAGNGLRAQHQQRRLMIPQRQQNPLAHDPRFHPRMNRNALLPHFRLNPPQLLARRFITAHRHRCARRKRIPDRIDHMDQQQHRVPQPRQFLRAAQCRRRLLRKIDSRHDRLERERLRGVKVRRLPVRIRM